LQLTILALQFSVRLTQLAYPFRRVSLFFGRWRFLTNGYDHFVAVALVVFGALVFALVASGFVLIGGLLSVLTFILNNDGVIVLVFFS
jgi:hypothetical protein